ncbi:beta-propeller fold lactonase family protein [Mucilaginibacter gossypii]|uniref:Gliding motility-associated C-terminal domain-containing protein n=1 Tax=Mucilaginibacter gossypii TaxID=551996 RepID=A0A1G8ADJ9_9SPHI|nr:beta-propeller fold lactonase family protein [Mucilaginibacter gossypii]SDH18979.1 gliding motility-associated C-terminal domain-containing protein [Mucilaginibacter gossypii]
MQRLLYVVLLITFFFSFLVQTAAQSNQTVTNGDLTTPAVFPGIGCSYIWKNNNPSIGLSATGAGNIQAFEAINTGNTPVTATITATPTAAGIAYILSNIGQLTLIDLASNQIISNSPTTYHPFGEAISPDGKIIYITDPDDGSVISVNAATFDVLGYTPTGPNSYPRAIAVSPDGSKVYVANAYIYNDYGTVNIIDTKTHNIITTTNVGSNPSGLVLSPDGSKLYVANHNSTFISVLNAITGSTIGQISMTVSTANLAIAHDGSELYATTDASFTNGTAITVINTATNQVTKTIIIGYSPASIAVSPDDKKLYVTNEDINTVSVIDNQTKTIVANILLPGGSYPISINLSPDGTKAYAVNQNGLISVINTANNTVINSIQTVTGALSYGKFISAGSGCSSSPVTFNITVKPTAATPLINAGPVSGTILACAGSASTSPHIQQFIVRGSNLTAAVAVTAPAGFEVSLSQGSGYSNTLSINPSGGGLSKTIYVRSAESSNVGGISGNVKLKSAGTSDQQVAVAGIVNALPTVNTVPNQVKANGTQSDPVTLTGSGNTFTWVNDHPEIGLAVNGEGDIAAFTTTNNTASAIVAKITATPLNSPYAYITNSASSSVSVINVATHKVIKTIVMGTDPQDITVSHDGKKVYVSDPISNTVSVIDVATNTVSATISVPAGSFSMAVSPDNSKLYLVAINPNLGNNDVYVINTATNHIISTLHVGVSIGMIALSPNGDTLYATDNGQNNLLVMNASNGQLQKTIPVGAMPASVIVSNDGTTAYVCNSGANTISIINTATNTVVKTVTVGTAPFALALSPDGSILYATGYSDGSLTAINTSSNTLRFQVNAGQYPMGVSVTPDGESVYVANSNSGTITVISALTGDKLETIPVGLNPFSIGSFITPVNSCPGQPVSFTITVKPTTVSANIKVSGNIDPLATIYGTSSATSGFIVSATNLTSGIQITPPSGFEVSTNGVNFSQTVTAGTTGTLAATPVYIRLSATTPVGNYTGAILVSADNTASKTIATANNNTVSPAPLSITANNVQKTYGETLLNVAVSPSFTSTGLQNGEVIGSITLTYGTGAQSSAAVGMYPLSVVPSAPAGGTFNIDNYTLSFIKGSININQAPLTITANNQKKYYGDENPALTVSYSGFVNMETASVLSPQPLVTTDAIANSIPGQYPILVYNAGSTNYAITYVSGTLTIEPVNQLLIIPNTFTPNGDGINDVWKIKNIEDYPKCVVTIYNRYGEQLLASNGYGIAWDGKYKGKDAPAATYYYLIDIKNGGKPLSGWVTIIR